MLSALAKFLIGFIAGIILLVSGCTAIAYFFLTTFSTIPPRPTFAEERIKPRPVTSVTKGKKLAAVNKSQPTSAKSTPTPTPSQTPTPKPEPGLYQARITWNAGLSLRDNPSAESTRIGGVGYNEKVVVLEESSDKKWLRVSLKGSEQKGWIKAGNTERINSEDEEKPNAQSQ